MLKFLSRKNHVFVTQSLNEEERKKLYVTDHVPKIEEAFIQAGVILKNEKKKN